MGGRMGGERWWIIDEVARWWRTAPEEARWLLMRQGLDGDPRATLAEIQKGALVAELDEDPQAHDLCASIIEAWSVGKGVTRR